MKQIIIAFLLYLGLITSLQAQLQIDSVFIDNDTLLPDPNFQQQISMDTIFLEGVNFNFRGVSNMPAGVDTVLWRVSMDYNQDGDFDDGGELLYFSGKIPVGSSPQVILENFELLMIPFGEILLIKVELTDDADDFTGGSTSANYNSFIVPAVNGNGGRVAMGNKSSSGSNQYKYLPPGTPKCCILSNGNLNDRSFEFFIYNWSNIASATSCTASMIELTEAVIYYENSGIASRCTLNFNTDNTLVSATKYDATGVFDSQYPDNAQFGLTTDEKARYQINLNANCASIQIDQVDSLEIRADFQGCGTFVTERFCVGCREQITYSFYSTQPSGVLEYLPPYTKTRDYIILQDSVEIVQGDSVELQVDDIGYIQAKSNNKSVVAESGAYFWAHKGGTCASSSNNSTIVEERTKQPNLTSSQSNVLIAPNPFQNTFRVEINLENNARVSIEIYDVLGRLRQQEIDNQEMFAGKNILEIDASTLSVGIYHCRVFINDRIEVKTIVKTDR